MNSFEEALTPEVIDARRWAWLATRAYPGRTVVIGEDESRFVAALKAIYGDGSFPDGDDAAEVDCVVLGGDVAAVAAYLPDALARLAPTGRILTTIRIGPGGSEARESMSQGPVPIRHLESEGAVGADSGIVWWQASWSVTPEPTMEFWGHLMETALSSMERMATNTDRLAAVVASRVTETSMPTLDAMDIGAPTPKGRQPQPRLMSPFGFRRVVGGRVGVVGSLVGGRVGVEGFVGVLAGLGVGVDLFGVTDGVGLPEGMSVFPGRVDAGLVQRLRPYAGVLDHPTLHESPTDRARILMTLAAAGVPVTALDVDQSLTRLIGAEMAAILTTTTVEDLTDPEKRDRLSVQLRRYALNQGTQTATWRFIADTLGLTVAPHPTISILLGTRRPDFLEHALDQAQAQTYPNTELVLILHGDNFTQTDSQIQTRYQRPLNILRIPTKTVYGETLNQGTSAATGTLITKMDDDDWYSKHHLWDLTHALDYSRADLVGKAAEYVYLEELDITIRRMVEGAETYGNRNLGGGTLLIHKHTLHQIGGWRRVPRHVDQGLLTDLARRGHLFYRTFGHGYILHRRSEGHTWDASVDYFLDQSGAQYRGLAQDAALAID